ARRGLRRLVAAAPDARVGVEDTENVEALARAASEAGITLNVMVDVDVGGRRTGVQPGDAAVALARHVLHRGALRLCGLQGYAGHCAHVIGWARRPEAAHRANAPLVGKRRRPQADRRAAARGRGDVVAGGSGGTLDMEGGLGGLTELQSGSYCVMDLDYRRIGGRGGDALTDFEMALTVATTVISVPTDDRAMVDAGLKAFSTDKPFPPEAVERPGVEYGFAGDEHGRLTIVDRGRAPRLGERIEFFPPHCDPTFNLYDRVWCVRGPRVEAVWDIAARGRSD